MTRAAAIASRAALAVLLAAAFLRAMVMLDPFPYWSGDPTLINIPMTALGPAGSLLLDTISLLAAAAILFTEPILSRRILRLPFALVSIGAIGIILHGWILNGPSLDNIRIGATWAAALFGALAAAHAARDAHTARLIAATSIGLIAMLAAKGFVQVFVEHPMTVEMFHTRQDDFLRSQGWAPGSAAALSFERRLTQPEATTWFGLANVTASFAAASLTALLGWTILAWRETRTPDQRLPSGFSGLLTIGTLAALAAVILAGGKGGYVAATLGLALLAVPPAAGALTRIRCRTQPSGAGVSQRRLPPLAPLLPLLLVTAALSALLLRGLFGERLGELSLLFRWFYISTAARIFTLHPLTGIGPANFQDAYQLLKPAISPEEVTSPHSILFDFTATLGLFGIAFAGLFLLWASRAGSVLLRSIGAVADDAPSPSHRLTVSPSHLSSSRPDLWFLLFTTAAPTLLSAWIEAPIATPDSTIMRLLGLAAWIGIALAALALMRLTDAWRTPFAAAAIVLAVHGQIEVTPIWPGSAAIFFLVLACAGIPVIPSNSGRQPTPRLALLPGLSLLGAAAILLVSAAIPAWKWEYHLAVAAGQFDDYAQFRARLELQRSNPRAPGGDSLSQLHTDIRSQIVVEQRSEPPSVVHDLATVFSHAAAVADWNLREYALQIYPNHLPTLLAASRLLLQRPALDIEGHHPFAHDSTWADRAEHLAVQATNAAPASAASWAWLGTLRAARFDMDHDRTRLEKAIVAWTHAAALDPHGLSMPRRLMRANAELGNPDQARLWANRALEANINLRLDPLKQLSPNDLAEVRARATP